MTIYDFAHLLQWLSILAGRWCTGYNVTENTGLTLTLIAFGIFSIFWYNDFWYNSMLLTFFLFSLWKRGDRGWLPASCYDVSSHFTFLCGSFTKWILLLSLDTCNAAAVTVRWWLMIMIQVWWIMLRLFHWTTIYSQLMMSSLILVTSRFVFSVFASYRYF